MRLLLLHCARPRPTLLVISLNSRSAAAHKSTRRCPPVPHARRPVAAFRPAAAVAARRAVTLVAQAAAAPVAAPASADASKKSQYALQTLTTWLLDLERE